MPQHVSREDERQRDWYKTRSQVLLDEIVAAEIDGPGVVEHDAHWLAIVPWWAAWPFETLIIARDPVTRLEELSNVARYGLAILLGRLMKRYDALFATSFPYSFGWHGAPHCSADTTGWRLHAHVYPPFRDRQQ